MCICALMYMFHNTKCLFVRQFFDHHRKPKYSVTSSGALCIYLTDESQSIASGCAKASLFLHSEISVEQPHVSDPLLFIIQSEQ